jgi:hypothetical protein
MEVVLILIVAWRMDSFWDEAMCHVKETHGVGVFQDYASQWLAVHDLIWDLLPPYTHLWETWKKSSIHSVCPLGASES